MPELLTSKSVLGELVPIPTLLFDVSTCNVLVSTVKLPVNSVVPATVKFVPLISCRLSLLNLALILLLPAFL